MTVASENSRITYAGDGTTTAFTVNFYFLSNTDLTAILTTSAGVQTTLVLNTDYTLTGAGSSSGGTLTCNTAPAAGSTLQIIRIPAYTQETDYTPNDPFPAESHERALDKLTMLAQRLKDLVSRAVHIADGDATGASTLLPTPTANKILGWDQNGTALLNYDVQDFTSTIAGGTFTTQTFSGNGSTTSFTLSQMPASVSALEVFISGVRQKSGVDYNISGTTLLFTSAPPSGSSNIFCRWGSAAVLGYSEASLVNWNQLGTGSITRDVESKFREEVSVTDFGADPTGVAESTDAFRKFFNYINTSLGGATAGYTGTSSTRTAKIPAGNYIIGGPVALGSYLDVVCDKRAMFTAKVGYTGVMFYSVTPYQIRWSGGIFQSSANGVGGIWWMGNANYPTSPVNLDQGFCVFENFEAKGFQDVFPVLVNRSAQMLIRKFKCDRNIHLIGRGTNLNTTTGLYSQTAPQSGYGGYADKIDIGSGWITSSDLMSDDFDAVICGDTIYIKDLLLVPVPHSGKECAWVNAWLGHKAHDIRYGGEPGSIAPCNWMGDFANTYPVFQTFVNISNSNIYNTEALNTTLATSINSTTTTVVLADGSKLPNHGQFVIGSETFRYYSKSGNTFTCIGRETTASSHTAGDSVTSFKSTVVRLFNNAPNLISITGNNGGVDMKSFVDYSYSFSNFNATWANINSILFSCDISGNNLTTMIGDFNWSLTNNTILDRDRHSYYLGTATSTGTPGNIRTVITNASCAKSKTYRLRMRVDNGAYQQALEGILSINQYYDGGATVMLGSFTKTADIDPLIGGAPSNLDVVVVKFKYPSGAISAGNTIPYADKFQVVPVLDVSASLGGVGGSEVMTWELMN